MKINNKNSYIIFILLIIVGFFIIYSINKTIQKKAKIEKEFVFPKTININNTTRYSDYDTTLMIIINKIFGYDTLHLDVFYVNNSLINDKYDVKAHILKHYFIPHTYMLFLNKNLLNGEILMILVHEMIHLDQYQRGMLKVSSESDYYIYNNDTVRMIDVPYLKRKYEIEAFEQTSVIMEKYFDIIKK